MMIIDKNNAPHKEAEALRKKAAADPLVLRRQQIEEAFLDELTRLTRKYGLAIRADTRIEYGEHYPDHRLEIAGYGTAGKYQVGTFGIEWAAGQRGDTIPCSPEERSKFEKARSARKAEDAAIGDYDRRISKLNFEAMQIAREVGMKHWIDSQPKMKPNFSCGCGESFRSEKKLGAHMAETGHERF